MSTTEDMHIHVADEFDVPNRRSNWHASGTLTHAQKYFLKKVTDHAIHVKFYFANF